MADSSDPGNPEYAAWDRGTIRGLGKRRRFVGTEKDEQGREINIYEVVDEEWDEHEQQTGAQRWPTDLHRWPRS